MDSDSDDSLLGKGPIFKRPSRAEERKRSHQKSVLDTALADSERFYASMTRMSAVKQEYEDHDDEELRARAKEITENQKSAAERRRENMDAMEGIIIGEDDDGALDRQRRIELAHAFDAERSTCLGVRNTISFDPSRAGGAVSFFFTKMEAMQSLEKILQELEKDKSAYSAGVAKIVERLRIVIRAGVFPEFLMEKRLDRFVVQQNNEIEFLPASLSKWFYQMALSSGLGSIQFMAESAFDTFMTLQKHGKIPPNVVGDVKEFVNALQCWIDTDASAKVKSEGAGENSDPNEQRCNRNEVGLSKMLSIWNKALPALSIEQDTAMHCIKALSLLGLDQAVTDRKYVFGLQPLLLDVIACLLDLVVENCRSDGKQDEEKLKVWMNATAASVVESLSKLGPGLAGAEDVDDTNAWLCHPNILRLLPHVDPKVAPNKVSCQFKATLAIQSLEACLGLTNIYDVVDKILSLTNDRSLLEKAESSLGWFAMAVSYVAIKEIDLQRDTIAMDGPRCLAIVESAFYCLEAGFMLLKGFSLEPEYTAEEAIMVVHVVELLDSQYLKLSKRLAPMGTQPHLRRADYQLNCCRLYLRLVKERAGHIAGISPDRVAVQSTLTSFFDPSNTIASP